MTQGRLKVLRRQMALEASIEAAERHRRVFEVVENACSHRIIHLFVFQDGAQVRLVLRYALLAELLVDKLHHHRVVALLNNATAWSLLIPAGELLTDAKSMKKSFHCNCATTFGVVPEMSKKLKL